MTLNSSGGIAGFDDYYPFGAQMPGRSSVSSAEFRYRFTGKERDVNETGWDYFGARYYDSRIGRWLQVDPLVDWEVGWSPYNYVRNNPVNAVDRDGRLGETLLDLASIAVSTYEFIKDPSWENGAYLAGDVGATLIPFVPAPTAVKTVAKLVGHVDDVKDGAKTASKLNDTRNAMQRGKVAEDRVLKSMGLEKNTQKVSGSEGKSIPDAVTKDKIIEVKDTKTVSNTKQMRIQREAATNSGKKHVVVTGKNTKVSENLDARSKVERRDDLGPKK